MVVVLRLMAGAVVETDQAHAATEAPVAPTQGVETEETGALIVATGIAVVA